MQSISPTQIRSNRSYQPQAEHSLAVLFGLFLLLLAVGSTCPVEVSAADDRPSLEEIEEVFSDDNAGTQSDIDNLLEGFDEETAADDASPVHELMDGFDTDTAPEGETGPALETADGMFRLEGYFRNRAVANVNADKPSRGETDWRGLSSLRTELQLELHGRFSDQWRLKVEGRAFYDFAYAINGRSNYTDQVLDDYQYELELGEAYIQGSLMDSLDIKVGRQVVVWGKSDNIRVTDILNPLDLREPGMTDIEHLRLPVAMTKLDYYLGNWTFSGMAIHEIRFNKEPPFGSDFYPLNIPLPDEKIPSDSLANTEWAASVSAVFPGWDLAFYYADVYDDASYLNLKRIDIIGPPPFPPIARPILERKHTRITMIGTATDLALGNWLLKGEVAWLDGLRFFRVPTILDKKFSRWDVLLGVEYTGFDDTSISLEAVNRHLNDFDDRLEAVSGGPKEDRFQAAFRITRDFWNETLSVSLLASVYGLSAEDGAFERLWVEYDVNDSIVLTGGVVLYQSGDLLVDYGDNDRVFVDVTYHF